MPLLNTKNTETDLKTTTITDEEMLIIQGEFIDLGKKMNIDPHCNAQVKIHVEELRKLLCEMRGRFFLSEADINKALKQIDTNGDGMVDLAMLKSVIEKHDTEGIIYKALSQRSKFREDFERYDIDKNGFITLDELKHVVKERTGINISEKHLEGMLSEVDCNEDGFIDYKEFCFLMTKAFMRKRIVSASPSNSRQNSIRKKSQNNTEQPTSIKEIN